MGTVIAAGLHKSGYPLSVYNRTRERAAGFSAAGCAIAGVPGELAALSDVVIVMVSDEKAAAAVLTGPGGLLGAGFTGKVLVSMSTLPVPFVNELAALCAREGVRFLDCPVSGSRAMAEAKQLVFLAAGDRLLVEELSPLLLAVGKDVVYAGLPPDGTGLKLCVNLILAQMTNALGEAVALARTLGIAPETIFEVMDRSPAFNCGFFRLKRESALGAGMDAPPLFRNMRKDVRCMLDEARKGGRRLPVLEALEKVLDAGAAGPRAELEDRPREQNGKA